MSSTQHHSSSSARVDMVIDTNVTWQDAFQFDTPTGVSWSLTGQSFQMEVKVNRYDATALLLLTTANGRIIVDDVTQRVIHFNVNKTDLQAALRPGVYKYDLVMFDNSNPAIRVSMMHGDVEAEQGVTQS